MLLFPRVIQTWKFIRRYVFDSDRLNWGTKAACRATMRDVLAAAEDCSIGTTMRSPEAWAPLVALMNMPNKKQDLCLQKMRTANAATFSDELIVPTTEMRDKVSYPKNPLIVPYQKSESFNAIL